MHSHPVGIRLWIVAQFALMVAGLVLGSGVISWPTVLVCMALVWFFNRKKPPPVSRGRRVSENWEIRARRGNVVGGLLLVGFALVMGWGWKFGLAVFPLWLLAAPMLVALMGLYQLSGYCVCTKLTLRNEKLVAGATAQLAWNVSAPMSASAVARFIIREKAVGSFGNGELKVIERILYCQELPNASRCRGQASLLLPDNLPPSQYLGVVTIEWVLQVTVTPVLWPRRMVELPLDVHGVIGEPESIETVPGRVRNEDIILDVQRRNVVGGECVCGTIAWKRIAPPQGRIFLQWEIIGNVPLVNVVSQSRLSDLRQPLSVNAHAGPYRGIPSNETAPLKAHDKRQFEFVMPTEPWSHSVRNLGLAWFVVVRLDNDEVRIPIYLGPVCSEPAEVGSDAERLALHGDSAEAN